ncbi:MAG TPA: hypothetical protein VHZ03_56930, partial [Trebonia sp.]|nr:hypothetical protein [Trebonia sp.]
MPAAVPGRGFPCWPAGGRAGSGTPTCAGRGGGAGQQRARRDQATAAQAGWQQAGQCGQDRPVGPVRPGTGDLATQDRYLMTEHHDLGVLRR